jgi:hypothetical protein
METNTDEFDKCYKCHKEFHIYQMFVYNSKNICIPCYRKFGFYYEVGDESKRKAKQIYKHVPRHFLDYQYAALDPDKWTD